MQDKRPYTGINSMAQRPKGKAYSVRLPKKNTGESLHGTEFGNDVLHGTPKAKGTEEK